MFSQGCLCTEKNKLFIKWNMQCTRKKDRKVHMNGAKPQTVSNTLVYILFAP